MFVHIDSTAIHVLDVEEETKTDTILLKANGVCLNFANKPIRVQVEVYVPKANPSWLATTSFTSDDVIEVAGTLTALQNNTLTVCLNFIFFVKLLNLFPLSTSTCLQPLITYPFYFFFNLKPIPDKGI